jgi:hypothetical protein
MLCGENKVGVGREMMKGEKEEIGTERKIRQKKIRK